jgi:hypothetical protein
MAPIASHRACAIDAAAVGAIAATIGLASHRPVVMTGIVAAVLALRFVAWLRLPSSQRAHSPTREVAFFALCTALGAGNDWNSVVRHRIYDYTVADCFVSAPGIPVWMLVYWGMILRFVATLCRWEGLDPPPSPAAEIHMGGHVIVSPWLKVAGEIVLTLVTRQMIYAYYLHPLLSWLPFAAALGLHAVVFHWSRHDRRLVALAAVGGPVVEMLFIRVGGLHVYHLGWFGGVPLWIVLWWMLAVLVWNDVSARLLARPARTDPAIFMER